ncbi:MAG: CRISPR-associated helicase Cas3' [Saprospiraceae bacterium]
MKPLSVLLGEAMRVEENLLTNAEKYLAHIPKPGDPTDKKEETLGEHMDLVLKHARNICALHGLDDTVERLVGQVVNLLKFDSPEQAADWVLAFFVNTIAFHDFGKVNEHFQTKRMQNDDALFRGDFPEIFTPCSGHSDLGGYIFSVYHLEKIRTEVHSAEDQKKLSVLALLFCNTILLHHSPRLKQPQVRVAGSQFLKFRAQLGGYLQIYKGFPAVEVSEKYFLNIEGVLNMFGQKPTDFTLFALLRLNFSLLTASDYLATWHYGYGSGPENEKDWGVLSEAQQAALRQAARTSKDYNARAYEHFESGNYAFQHPIEASEDNLNTLRTEMAVEVLQQLAAHPAQRIFYLEAPTGGGKTNLSMLAVAELLRANPELNKVFYVFPFTTLITQTHKAIRETLQLGDDDIALLHSRAGFQTLKEADAKQNAEEKEDGTYGSRRRDFLQNLFVLYPFSLVTHIRFFDILKSKNKDDIYLMHRLANSVVVLDELQSYPPKQWDKMLYLLDQYSRFFNIRFILMSATLPRLDKIEAVGRVSGHLPEVVDLLPRPERYFQNPNFKGRVQFKFDLLENREADIALPELAEVVLTKSRQRAAANDGRVFTIVEFIFKKSATEFWTVIDGLEKQEAFFGENIFVLSGTILESRRREIIAFLKRNRKTPGLKVLVITTQVVEAGVDIDMDMGFKNVSLIDSDEQLAGRVNRNVSKHDCAVYLFKINEPYVLYGSDLRHEVTRNLPPAFHRDILETKNFGKLYERVFAEIEKLNKSEMIENFEQDYLGLVQKLDFPEVDDKFKIIDQPTLSVFVPVLLPVEIENEKGEPEPFFNGFELMFLEHAAIYKKGDPAVDGAQVWKLYREIVLNMEKPSDYVSSKIKQKTLQGILSKFTFSLFESKKNWLGLRSYCDENDCFENYFYLTRHYDLYDLKAGLGESKLKEPDNIF